MPTLSTSFDAVVIGGGPTGLLCGLALSRLGVATAICGKLPTPGQGDQGRTAALFRTSIAVLEKNDCWSGLEAAGAALNGIRIVDGMWQGLRAPEVLFDAASVGEPQLGWNIPNNAIIESLAEVATAQATCSLYSAANVVEITPGPADVTVRLATGETLRARLVIGADGRRSLARAAAGIALKSWDYNQTAIGTHFAHSRDHRGISTEFHRSGGPLTVIPMQKRRSSLVWVERPGVAAEIAELSDNAFITELESRLQGLLGSIKDVRPRVSFPLSGSMATKLAQNRVALVGEAAHAFPPIGAQGLNLGIRDVDCLADCVAESLRAGGDIGAATVLSDYDRLRKPDVMARTIGVDMLSKSLTSAMFPVTLARGAVLHAVNALPAMKRLMIEAGMAAPATSTDRSHRP